VSTLLPQLSGQTDSTAAGFKLDYVEPDEYEIGGIRVRGNDFSDANAIIAISGLRVGDRIRIPGVETEKAVKALWKIKLFTDVQIAVYKRIADIAFLEIRVREMPRLSGHILRKIRKSRHEDINDIVKNVVRKATIVTPQVKDLLRKKIKEYYVDKGFLDAKVHISQIPDTTKINAVKLVIAVDRHKKVKIHRIIFHGNKSVKARKLRRQMKDTKEQRRLLASSKLIRDEYEDDKRKLIAYYNKLGFRDARILRDSIVRLPNGKLDIHIFVREGHRYYFRNIKWKGNTIYDDKRLAAVLGIKKGDVYDTELLNKRLHFSQDGRDVSSLYLDNGYLAFRIEPVETAVVNDSVDIEFQIFEGPQFTVDRVIVKGNDRTHEHVIRREIRTKPGQKFSRAAIIRTQRELLALGYFDPEKFNIQTPTNPQRGTVDIVYEVEEKPSDQLELSAGYQPGRQYGDRYYRGSLIGTLGVKFSNFSVADIRKKGTWTPYPQGDGQTLSIRGQVQGNYRKSITASFTEPWLGGRRPTSLTVASSFSHFSLNLDNSSFFRSFNNTVSLGRRLKFPDDNFIASTALSYELLTLKKTRGYFQTPDGRSLETGKFHNLAIIQDFTRSTISYPLFPEKGSRISLKIKATPPYSLFRAVEPTDLSEKYKFTEYIKFRINAEWYTSLGNKFVLKTGAKLGYLGQYTQKHGQSPFERFELGGDALNQQSFQITSREFLTLRGYDNDLATFPANGFGAAIFNKYTLELRYPVSLNPSSTVYVLSFLEAGNAWDQFSSYNPFDLKRSAGVGLRVFLPMFGTIGFDYGLGFDKTPSTDGKSIFSKYGKFNLIIGFEPE